MLLISVHKQLKKWFLIPLLIFFLYPTMVAAQIRACVDAASFSPAVAPGGLISIFGTNLARGVEAAQGFPLPTELGGVQVTFDGTLLPLLFVSSTQINAQLPFTARGTATLRATYPGGASELRVTVAAQAPAIFRVPTPQGSIPGIIHQDGTLVSSASPARPGEVISVYLTGLGETTQPVAVGHPAPPSAITNTGSVAVNLNQQTLPTQFAGLAPGFAGLNQVNVQVPPLSAGTFMLRINSGSSWSNGVMVPVAATGALQRYEYVFPDGGFYVYDMDNSFSLVKHVIIPQATFIRGVAANPATNTLYISYGGDGGVHGNGSMLAYDLLADRVMWSVSYPFGIDSMALTPDGRRIYMPIGELSSGSDWMIIDAQNGATLGRVQGGAGPHNTVVSADGRRVYLGPREDRFLYVVDAATNSVVRAVGPLINTVRPFVVNGKGTLVFTTATAFLGFQVSDLTTGQVLYTVPISGYSIPPSFTLSTPSHGISMSPDEKEIWVLDSANSAVHVFDISGLPASPPRQIFDLHFSHPMTGNEHPCYFDCGRHGWVQHSIDGRFVFVGDSGDVFDAVTKRHVVHLDPLYNSRKHLEIDWNNGLPVATSTRHSNGYITQ